MIGIYARDPVTWLRATAADEYGEPGTPVETSIKARVVWKTRQVISFAGEEVIATGHVRMSSQPTAGDALRIGGVLYTIVAVEQRKAFAKSYHYRAYIQ